MCRQHPNPIFCAIPPYIFEEIRKNGNDRQKEKVNRIITHSAQVRGKRQSLAELASKPSASIGNKQRTIYNCQNSDDLPGTLVRNEGDPPSGDQAADEAYDGAGATYDLYDEIFARNSIDNNGLQLISSVHYLQGYDNAFWDGEQMVYGDGDEDLPVAQRLFNRFTSAIDVIGHELTHGVTQYEASLAYFGQSGALNESFSDVFGSLVKQRLLNHSATEADWLIGSELLTNNVSGLGIRSMKSPGTAYDDPILGKDPQPDHMNDYVTTTRDNGGVHINSGIPNKAFYLTALELGGYSWEKAGRIWYNALCEKLTASSDFKQAAELTYQSASELYGGQSDEAKAVSNAWQSVGLPLESSTKKGCNPFAGLFGKKSSNA